MSSPIDPSMHPSPWIRLDHVQLAIPVRGEVEARGFYVGVLGLTEGGD